MLPPQLQRGLRPRSASMPASMTIRPSTLSTVGGTQSRCFWGWRRLDYASHIDPMFHRFNRYRTLKTRAKLIDKIRRRGRWDWDENQKPFFSSKQIRLASHSSGKPRWRNSEEVNNASKEQSINEDDGHELSKREREWKDQMESMRKRIEQDPYEAVFGRRFEPFWSPLVPSWMREEMGLDRWTRKKPKEAPSSRAQPSAKSSSSDVKSSSATADSVDSTRPGKPNGDAVTEGEGVNGQLTDYTYTSKQATRDPEGDGPDGQLTNYSYSSSTSWDSWTQKTRREEWDSISGQTRRYEYDPITNRMVQIESSQPATENSIAKAAESQEPSRALSATEKLSNGHTKRTVKAAPSEPTAMPVEAACQPRKAVPVAPQTLSVAVPKSSVYFPSLLNTSIARHAVKPSALTSAPETKKLDLLTAEEVRASVGRGKPSRDMVGRHQSDLNDIRAHRYGKADISKSEWDQAELRVMLDREMKALSAKKAKLLNDEHGLFHIERQKKELQKLDQRMSDISTRIDQLDAARPNQQHDLPLKTTSTLQPSVERMQSRTLPAAEEPDDSAAHESTGDRLLYNVNNVPKDWEKQAELLQAHRVLRTRGTQIGSKAGSEEVANPAKSTRLMDIMNARKAGESGSDGKVRWIDIMNKRKAAFDAQMAELKAANEAGTAEKRAKLEKANKMLETEVKEQKLNMQAHENRYAHKIRSLRQELETAYKQSSINAEMQVERTRDLEKELEKWQKAAGDSSSVAKYQNERQRFQQKISDLRKELDTTFRQSSINSEMHVERIRQLEKELAEARKNTSTSRNTSPEAVQAEGDFCANIAKYAKDSNKWYKRPAHGPDVTGKPEQYNVQKARQVQQDRLLIREVRNIYESKYGKIDVNHRQPSGDAAQLQVRASENQVPQVVEVESDVDLGKALADYEKEQTYQFQADNLENEIAAQEQDAHEAQALMAPESSGKMKQIIANKLQLDQDVHGARLVDDTAPKLIPTEITARKANIEHLPANTNMQKPSIKWAEPPVYKVLAYDSGNDMFSTATTSSNFTGKEAPISIPEALSQLYQPARFVPHFAELQKEGFQVIHGTKDLLVFKKVQTNAELESPAAEAAASLQDHGMVKSADEVGSRTPTSASSVVNPIDGTTRPVVEPNTGSFASPTGFVGDRWDAITAAEGRAQAPSTVSSSPNSPVTPSSPDLKSPHECYSQPADEDVDTDVRHYPRVKREERVFSGSRLQGRKRERRRHHHEPSSEQVREMRRRWNGYRSRAKWALGTGLAASVVAYGVGAAAEKKERRDMERWEQILEGKRARWE